MNNNSFISSTPILIPYIYSSCFIHWLGLPRVRLTLEWLAMLNTGVVGGILVLLLVSLSLSAVAI